MSNGKAEFILMLHLSIALHCSDWIVFMLTTSPMATGEKG